jgi:hypothetical protein
VQDRWNSELFASISRTEEGNILKRDYVIFPSAYYEACLKCTLNTAAPFLGMDEIQQAEHCREVVPLWKV